MKEILNLDDIPFAEKGQFSGKVSGAPITKFDIDIQAHVDVGTSPVLSLGGAHSLIDQFEVRQGQEILISLEGKDLAFFAEMEESQAEALNPTTASTTNLPAKATASLDIAKLGPVGTMVDAGLGNAEVVVLGRFGQLADACAKWTPPTDSRNGTLRVTAHTASRVPSAGLFRPNLVSNKIDLGAGPSAKRTFRFEAQGPEGGILMGFYIRAFDNSASAAGLNDANADNLIRRITVDGNTRRYKGRMLALTWGQGKRHAARKLGLKRNAAGSLPQGRIFIPFEDDAAPAWAKGGLTMAKGDSVTLSFDTLSDVEEEFGAAAGVTAASGDQVVIVPFYFTRLSAAGQPSTVLANSANPAQVPTTKRSRLRRVI